MYSNSIGGTKCFSPCVEMVEFFLSSNHVLSEDTIFREIRGNKLFTKRLLTKTNRVPKWGERFVNARTVKIVEESITDPNEKVLITYTRNIGYVRVMVTVFYIF
jgi:hypothetical protein